jgi:hypothetical protein
VRCPAALRSATADGAPPRRAPVQIGAGVPIGLSEGSMDQAESSSAAAPSGNAEDKFDNDDYPAYSMGRAAEILGVTPAFLRSVDAAKLISPQRSDGGHRRYSRYQLRLAARARELTDRGTPLEAACRIIILEDRLTEAQRINTQRQQSRQTGQSPPS